MTHISAFPHLTGPAVEAQVQQRAAAERPADGRFTFADTPRLSAALRAGDEAAFRWLHEQWNRRLFRYCFALAQGDDTLAAEIAQATYLRAFRHLRVLPDEAALWCWLARAARNAASDLRRTRGRYQGALARFAHWLGARDGPLDEREAGENEDTLLLAALDRALGGLAAEERALIEARYFEGRSLEEIGRGLGVSDRAIAGRLARLRGKLRRLIAAEIPKAGEPATSADHDHT